MKLSQEQLHIISHALEAFIDNKKELEKKEMVSMIENDLLLIVDSPCKKLQKLSRNISEINKILDIKVQWDR